MKEYLIEEVTIYQHGNIVSKNWANSSVSVFHPPSSLPIPSSFRFILSLFLQLEF